MQSNERSRSLPRSYLATQQDVGCSLAPCPGAEGIVLLAEAAGMADTMRMASRRAVCSHIDDAVGYGIPGCVGFVPEGALRAPWVSSRGRGKPCRLPNAYGLLWSCSSCSGAQAPSLWTRQPG